MNRKPSDDEALLSRKNTETSTCGIRVMEVGTMIIAM